MAMANLLPSMATLLLFLCLASSGLQLGASRSRELLNYGGYGGSGSGSGSGSSDGAPSDTTPTTPSSSGGQYGGPSSGSSYGGSTGGAPSSSGLTPTGRGTFSFWRAHINNWPKIISVLARLVRIFGGRSGSKFPAYLTLKDALESNGSDGYTSLAQQATASLLNSYAVDGFAFTPQDVKTQFNAALDDASTAAAQAAKFAQLNEQV